MGDMADMEGGCDDDYGMDDYYVSVKRNPITWYCKKCKTTHYEIDNRKKDGCWICKALNSRR